MKTFTTSWDDGHPSDLRLAELLLKYQIPATFYIPIKNVEGKKVMTSNQILNLSKHFQIGAHTYNHIDLSTVDLKTAEVEVRTGKEALEQIIGRSVDTFCYPRGHFSVDHQAIIRNLGFKSARSARLLSLSSGANQFSLHPNIHFFPHAKAIQFAHCFKHQDLATILLIPRLATFPNSIFDLQKYSQNNSFHIWGHSWELDDLDLWSQLEMTLEKISTRE